MEGKKRKTNERMYIINQNESTLLFHLDDHLLYKELLL